DPARLRTVRRADGSSPRRRRAGRDRAAAGRSIAVGRGVQAEPHMRVGVRVVTAAIVTGTATLGFAPIARADTTMSFSASQEAWYQTNPSCGSLAGCVTTNDLPAQPPTPVPPSPYPSGTMHIGYAAGQETARSYLSFPLSSVTGTVSSATLDVPLDVTQTDGSMSPDTSKVLVCTVSALVSPVQGSFD